VCNKNVPCIKKSQFSQHVDKFSNQEAQKRKLNTSKQKFLSESISEIYPMKVCREKIFDLLLMRQQI